MRRIAVDVFLLSIVFTLAGLYFLLLFNDDRTSSFLPPWQKVKPSDVPQQQVFKFWKETIKEESRVQTTRGAVTPASTTLGPCPETPPALVGPLKVELNVDLTWPDVRKKVSFSLQKGGRYKPPDCISNCKTAIIIPFRFRHEHLKHWLFFLHPILQRQQLDYGVYVINQDGEGIFNRAKLMNVGYVEALKDYDYDCFVFSDVDLVPMDDRNLYSCFDNPRHLAVAMDKFNFKLPYKAFFGGVSSLSKDQYLAINGFSNSYWGWGGEDDDIYNRITIKKMNISRPSLEWGKYKMIKHNRDLHNEKNRENVAKLKHTQDSMMEDGIKSLNYTVKDIVKDKMYTFITVDINAPLK